MAEENAIGDSENNVGDESSNESSSASSEERKTVDWQDHQRAMNDLHKFKDRSKSLNAENEELRKKIEGIEAAKLKEQEDWKNYAEVMEKKNADLEAKNEEYKNDFIKNEKLRAVIPELNKQGIHPDALERLVPNMDLSGIVVERRHDGRIECLGVREFTESFKKDYSFAFNQKTTNGVSSSGGSGVPDGGQMTIEKLNKLEDAYKAGKASRQEYLNAFKAYQQTRGV